MMTDEKNLSLITQYCEYLKKVKAEAIETDYDAYLPDRKIALNHLFSMLPKMEGFIRKGRREKNFRWLGFMQGVLWSLDEFSLNDCCNHNKPPAEK